MSSLPVVDPAGPMRLGMVAGEASGDLLAASVLDGLHSRLGDAGGLQACGIGGPAMVARGFDAWWPSERLAVRGYVEVLRAYPQLRAIRSRLHDRLLHWRPDVFVGVDAPDFNLELERRLRAAGTRVAHFIGPSIWAWRPERIDRIRASVDRMLLVFPFEPRIYEAAGIDATYVGHPLADAIPTEVDVAAARRALDLPAGRPVVAVLPGSRESEITYIAPTFVRTVAWLAARRPELVFVVPAANASLYARLRAMLAGALPEGADCRLVLGRSHDAIAAADAVLVASGTATLEVALFRKPMVIAYRMAWLSYRIMRRMAMLPWIGLPNILCEDAVVPEFVQDAATPEALGAALLAQLDDPALAARLRERFGELHERLRRDCASRAAEALLSMRPPGRGPSR
ncbi:MAG TPA: lipid-A-disaccharide synthase [Burkholderiaceae bacterium]|nr:lipid-A-disaccharide synthase [Burkholderiaceae bacterium]